MNAPINLPANYTMGCAESPGRRQQRSSADMCPSDTGNVHLMGQLPWPRRVRCIRTVDYVCTGYVSGRSKGVAISQRPCSSAVRRGYNEHKVNLMHNYYTNMSMILCHRFLKVISILSIMNKNYTTIMVISVSEIEYRLSSP
jgi:hypothetical protein